MPRTSPHASVRSDWLALRTEEILDAARPIIDAHHHLWDRPEGRYLLDELLADAQGGHNVVATIYVQAQSRSTYRKDGEEALRPVGEIEFAEQINTDARAHLGRLVAANAGIIGMADLTLGPDLDRVLECMIIAGRGKLRGIRNNTAWHADPGIVTNANPAGAGLLKDPHFSEGARRLGAHALSLDIWAFHSQLADVFNLAKGIEQISIILDHCGGPIGIGPYSGRRTEVFREWKSSMAKLAGLPNITVKLGGLGMRVSGFGFEQRDLPPSSEDLKQAWAPYIETCIELFGAHRCMFESNFPVDKGSATYVSIWNAFKLITRNASNTEKSSLFYDTAQRVYRLPLTCQPKLSP